MKNRSPLIWNMPFQMWVTPFAKLLFTQFAQDKSSHRNHKDNCKINMRLDKKNACNPNPSQMLCFKIHLLLVWQVVTDYLLKWKLVTQLSVCRAEPGDGWQRLGTPGYNSELQRRYHRVTEDSTSLIDSLTTHTASIMKSIPSLLW